MAEDIPATLLQDAPFSVTVLVNAFQSIELILAFFKNGNVHRADGNLHRSPQDPHEQSAARVGQGAVCGDCHLLIAKLQDPVVTRLPVCPINARQ